MRSRSRQRRFASGFPLDIAAAARIGAHERFLVIEHAADGFVQVTAVGRDVAVWAGIIELARVENFVIGGE